MSQRRYAANHFHRAAGSHPASCDAQLAIVSRRRLHVARRTSHHCAQGYGLGCRSACESASRNPRAAIRELWASRKPQLADCSSQHRGQACAEARLQLAEHRSQLADRGAGSPVPPIAACTSQLARRRLLRRLDRCSYFPPLPVLARPQPASSRHGAARNNSCRESMADPILLSQNCRPHSRRSQHFGQEVKADPILLSQNRRPHSRRSQHFGQEVKAEVNCGSHSRSSLVARCRSLSRRDYLHEDRLHACKVQGA